MLAAAPSPCTGAGEHQLWGGGAAQRSSLFLSVTIRVPVGYVPSSTEGRSRHSHNTTALDGGKGCDLLSPHCYLRVPHHRVSGQRAGGGIRSVSQRSLNRERGSDCESTSRGGEHAEVLPRGSDQHAQQPEGRSIGTCAGLGACQQMSGGGRYGSRCCPWPTAVPPLTTRWW